MQSRMAVRWGRRHLPVDGHQNNRDDKGMHLGANAVV
jgi:hypothetical protein